MAKVPVYFIDNNKNYYVNTNNDNYVIMVDLTPRKYITYINNKKYRAIMKTANGIVAVQPFIASIILSSIPNNALYSKDDFILLDNNNRYLIAKEAI